MVHILRTKYEYGGGVVIFTSINLMHTMTFTLYTTLLAGARTYSNHYSDDDELSLESSLISISGKGII